jgi:hypothetical protein
MNQSLFHETKPSDEVRIKRAIAWIKGLTDEQKIQIARETLESVNDWIVKLWRKAWGLGHWQNMSPYQRIDTERLIKEYGETKVRIAFEKAAENDVKNLAYVEGILKREAQNEAARKEIEEADRLKNTPASPEVTSKTAEVIRALRIQLDGQEKENKYLKKQPLSRAEYIREFKCADTFTEAEYREYKNNFK